MLYHQFILHINLYGLQFRSDSYSSSWRRINTNQNEIWQRISLQVPNTKFTRNQINSVGNRTCGQTTTQAHNAFIVCKAAEIPDARCPARLKLCTVALKICGFTERNVLHVTILQHRILKWFNPLKTKRRLLYLKTQFVPRSKHFSSRL